VTVLGVVLALLVSGCQVSSLILRSRLRCCLSSLPAEAKFGARIVSLTLISAFCWLAAGVNGLAAKMNTALTNGALNTLLTVIFVPLPATVNPFLYMMDRARENRNVKIEARLLDQVRRRKAACGQRGVYLKSLKN
jgi:hypothetical protein